MNANASANQSAPSHGMGKYLAVYLCILAIAGLQVLLAYHSAAGTSLMLRMLVLALGQGAIAVMFFMHLVDEKRNMILALIPTTIFVLLMMNMIWSDSFRLLHMRPFAN